MNDYIIFTNQVIIGEFREQLKKIILNEIEFYEHNLKIAEIIKFDDPIFKNFSNEGITLLNELAALYYKGSKILSQEKEYLEELLKETDNNTFNYDPILEQASDSKIISKSVFFFPVISLIMGLLVSSLMIIVRSVFLS